MLDIAETIRKGREWIERHGWVEGELMDSSTEKVCGYGAVLAGLDWLDWDNEDIDEDKASLVEPMVWPVMKFIVENGVGIEALKKDHRVFVGNAPVQAFIAWNDEEGRTEQEVLDAFAKAEKIARAGFDPDEGVTP